MSYGLLFPCIESTALKLTLQSSGGGKNMVLVLRVLHACGDQRTAWCSSGTDHSEEILSLQSRTGFPVGVRN